MNYPKRTDLNSKLGEGANCVFDRDKSYFVTVTWTGKKYKIVHAWKEKDIQDKGYVIEYPFIKTKADRSVVMNIIQSNCDHADWDYCPEHKICSDCETHVLGDFRVETNQQDERVKKALRDERIKKSTATAKIMTKKCPYRLHPFTLKDTENHLAKSWICLLLECKNFRKKCKDFMKQQCDHAIEVLEDFNTVFPEKRNEGLDDG